MIDKILRYDGTDFVWDTPLTPDDWTFETGQFSKMLSTSFQTSEHQNCSLILYARWNPSHDRGYKASMEDHNDIIQHPERWRVKSGPLHDDGRIGVHRFLNLPLTAFWRLWRRPINPRWNFSIEDSDWTFSYLRNAEEKKNKIPHPVVFKYGKGWTAKPFIVWPGVFDVERASSHGQAYSKVKGDFRRWLTQETEGDIYLFSDNKSTFESPDDEWIYLSDFGIDAT